MPEVYFVTGAMATPPMVTPTAAIFVAKARPLQTLRLRVDHSLFLIYIFFVLNPMENLFPVTEPIACQKKSGEGVNLNALMLESISWTAWIFRETGWL